MFMNIRSVYWNFSKNTLKVKPNLVNWRMNSNAPMNSLQGIPITFQVDESEDSVAVFFGLRLSLEEIREYAKAIVESYEARIQLDTWHVGKQTILIFEKL